MRLPVRMAIKAADQRLFRIAARNWEEVARTAASETERQSALENAERYHRKADNSLAEGRYWEAYILSDGCYWEA